jgi:UMP-CMP kinase
MIFDGFVAGKGTQCEYLVKEFGFVHLSAGELLREERSNPDSANGKLIDEHLKSGTIVPVEITVMLLFNRMKASNLDLFLIDGFPRNDDNIEGWERVVGNKAEVLGCLYFECPEDVMEKRILARSHISGRSDDNIKSIHLRFKTYQEETFPIIQQFQRQSKCWQVHADRPKEEISQEVRELLIKEGIQTCDSATVTKDKIEEPRL